MTTEQKPTRFSFPLELLPIFQGILVQALRGSVDLKTYEAVKRLEGAMRTESEAEPAPSEADAA